MRSTGSWCSRPPASRRALRPDTRAGCSRGLHLRRFRPVSARSVNRYRAGVITPPKSVSSSGRMSVEGGAASCEDRFMTSVVSRQRWMAVLCAAGAILASALAASTVDGASLYACLKNGTARVFTKKPRCKKHERRISWNVAGPVGKSGRTGAHGSNGQEGARGVTGAIGPAGPEGKQGDTGAAGATGATGATGPTGPEGKEGANGAVAGFSASKAAVTSFTAENGVTVVSKSLPAGNYIVFAKTVVTATAEAGTRAGAVCELIDPTGVTLDTARWAGPLVELVSNSFMGDATLSLQSELSTGATSTLRLECTDQSNDVNKLSIGATFSQLDAVQTSSNS
jgi:Collagen triple helix repeat (20 copies)